jgi:hypothetical protein
MIGGRNRPNKTSYLNVRDLRSSYNSSTASQWLEIQNQEKIPNPPKRDDTKSSQKKNMARTQRRKQGLECSQKPKA